MVLGDGFREQNFVENGRVVSVLFRQVGVEASDVWFMRELVQYRGFGRQNLDY